MTAFKIPDVTRGNAELLGELGLREVQALAVSGDIHSRHFSHIARDGSSTQSNVSGKDYLARPSHNVWVSGKTKKKSVNHLRAWREYRRLTQAELAEKVGTSDNVISLLESGGRRLSDKWLYKLAPALDTRAGFLLEFDPHDADLSILEAITNVADDRKGEALRLLDVFKTGTHD